MKYSLVRFLTAASLGLLINGVATPTKAEMTEKATSETKEVTTQKELPPHIREWAVLGAAGLAGLAVMLGTGNSMKHDKDAIKQSRANKGIETPSVRSN
ncbi:MAG: hypothetical protein QNJ38_19925 [Prochloraceae cyanobacterium]|nr:hypothetical protein [Prochloraceae cyanobacterium]